MAASVECLFYNIFAWFCKIFGIQVGTLLCSSHCILIVISLQITVYDLSKQDVVVKSNNNFKYLDNVLALNNNLYYFFSKIIQKIP